MDAAIQGAKAAIEKAAHQLPGPTLSVTRNKDGGVKSLTLTGGALHCGAPSSVTLTVGKDGKLSATGKSGFINPESFGKNQAHPATKSELNWLKGQIEKSKDLDPMEKAGLLIRIDALIDKAPEHAPDTIRPVAPPPQYIDDPSQIRKLQGKEPIMYAQAEFPETKKRG
jgi:hypothetical protein